MSMFEDHLDKILGFINTYNELVNCHLVDFITERLWERCLPEELKLELNKGEIGNDCWVKCDDHPELNKFLKLASSMSLRSCDMETNLQDLSGILPAANNEDESKSKHIKSEFMNAKKLHEVEVLGNIIAATASQKSSLVIDAGAGKAYLSTYLAENYKIPVLAIESSTLCHKGALCRQKKLQKKTRCSESLVQYINEEINDETDYVGMVQQQFCDWSIENNLILTGLHTCGSLAHSIIRGFLSHKEITALCIVPCCYHLTNQTLLGKSNFSKNARMLAQQSIERSIKSMCISPSLFFRAVLQVILHSLGIYKARIGRGGPLNDFPSYAKWALLKVGVKTEKMPLDKDLENVYQSYIHLKQKFNIFQMLRIHMAPVLEAAIVLDRIIFLQNSEQCSKLAILRLFDPVLSPRHYGIIAIKEQHTNKRR